MTKHKTIIRKLLFCFSTPLIMVALLGLTSWLLLYFPTKGHLLSPNTQLTIYIQDNGVHTDLVVPIVHKGFDWRTFFPPSDIQSVQPDHTHIAIGWGDREFYLNSPQWSDLTVSTAVGAILGLHPTLLRVRYLTAKDLKYRTHILPISDAQYEKLIEYVTASLNTRTGRATHVPGHFGAHDAFYEALGRYSILRNCNVWTGDALRFAGIPMSRWTPLPSQVTFKLQPNH